LWNGLRKVFLWKSGLALTSAGFLVPPALKTKARYMNLDSLVGWGRKALTYLKRLRRRRSCERTPAMSSRATPPNPRASPERTERHARAGRGSPSPAVVMQFLGSDAATTEMRLAN